MTMVNFLNAQRVDNAVAIAEQQPVADINKFLDFEKSKTQAITLEQLSRTQKEEDVNHNPIRGIHHVELFQQILQMCDDMGYQTEVYDLFAAHNKDRQNPGMTLNPELEAQFGERAVEAHTLRRVFANIRIKDFDSDGYTTNLAVAFHQRGIQVGFGNNVIICHNQCMLNPDLYAATYSEKRGGFKYEIKDLLEVVRGWLYDAKQHIISDRKKIEKMKAIDVPADQTLRIIGELTAIRVAHDSGDKGIRDFFNVGTYPLNQAQISDFTEILLKRYSEAKRVSVWDLYNSATELYKANRMDIPSLLPQNRAMVKYLEERFSFA